MDETTKQYNWFWRKQGEKRKEKKSLNWLLIYKMDETVKGHKWFLGKEGIKKLEPGNMEFV